MNFQASKKHIFPLSLFFLFFASVALGQVKWNQRYQNYIDTYKDVAIEEMLRYKIPASITLAQGLLESGAGESELARKGNNHFGIKCHGWTGRTVHHDDDLRNECFRAYDSPEQSYEDHSRFLSTGQRYASLFKLSLFDYQGWAHGLKAAGYATNPRYAYKLIEIIEAYQLYQFDYATSSSRKSGGSHSARAPKSPKEKTPGPTGATLSTDYNAQPAHEVRLCNGTFYVLAKRGDTFESIGHEMGVKAKKLAQYNELSVSAELTPGTPVYLEKKKSRADKVFKDNPHVVQADESLHSIAQAYALRLSALYKMNRIKSDHVIRPGDVLRVY